MAYKRKQRLNESKITQLKEENLRAQIEIQEQTLKSISQEIHDNIGQTLSLAKLNLNMANINDTVGTCDKLDHSSHLISKAITDLRNLAKALNKETILGIGLEQALKQEIENLGRTGAYEVQLITSGDPYPLGPQKEIILFRIVQEGLNNIIKHAKATKILLEINYQDSAYKITLSDNGIGLRESTSNKTQYQRGSGLTNMLNRAEIIGGQFEIENSSSNGTTMRITLTNVKT